MFRILESVQDAPVPVRIFAWGAMFGLPAWWTWRESGLFAWLSTLQESLFGVNQDEWIISVAGCFGVMFLLVAGALHLWVRWLHARDDAP